jgi:hypothetical protein
LGDTRKRTVFQTQVHFPHQIGCWSEKERSFSYGYLQQTIFDLHNDLHNLKRGVCTMRNRILKLVNSMLLLSLILPVALASANEGSGVSDGSKIQLEDRVTDLEGRADDLEGRADDLEGRADDLEALAVDTDDRVAYLEDLSQYLLTWGYDPANCGLRIDAPNDDFGSGLYFLATDSNPQSTTTTTPFTGTVVNAFSPGCEAGDIPPAGSPTDIALIERGACFFSTKIANAVTQGYGGVIVFNNVDDPTYSRVRMFLPNGDPGVPAVFISQQDGFFLQFLADVYAPQPATINMARFCTDDAPG